MFPALEIASDMKKAAFYVLDNQRRGQGKVWVDANRLINLCLAFESAAEGKVDNLEFIIAQQKALLAEAQRRLGEIAALAEVDSQIFDIACKHLTGTQP